MIIIKSSEEIAAMRRGGKILASIMEAVGQKIAPGVNTEELDKLAEELVFSNGGKPAFKGQGEKSNPYPATLCASINHEIVHGIPSLGKIIQAGDLVKIDMGIEIDGFITDMARTFAVGAVSEEAHKLVRATREALDAGIAKIRSGAKLFEYGAAVDARARADGFSVVHDLVGHGVGKKLHEDPQVPNYRTSWANIVLKEGMTLALEPMINAGSRYIKIANDGWTFVTKDGKLSAHFEDTVAVTKNGCEILTR
jgi:methionyl aminopeptidase